MPAVALEHVSKYFRKVVLRNGYTTFKSSLTCLLTGGSARPEYVEALRDVSLSIPPGGTLGIIGPNGSGKSTLIRVIAGIYRPTSGRVTIAGRAAALIELGAGFHPEFSGRENIYINGIILGLSKKEIRRRFDEIVEFAGLEEFIDSPVRTYSSGMYVRLGFSVAVHVDSDILLVDEVLAVGDADFTRKCLDKMESYRRQGKTLVLAAHNLAFIEQWCDSAILLEKGRVAAHGPAPDVVAAYRATLSAEVASGR